LDGAISWECRKYTADDIGRAIKRDALQRAECFWRKGGEAGNFFERFPANLDGQVLQLAKL
jgi:hypothetical protein